MSKAKRQEIGFGLDGIEPRHDLAWQLAGERGWRAYWREAARIALSVKDKSLARGLGVDGKPLADITQYTRDHRRSAMGKARASAPPLTPARRLSRTRAYLRAHSDEKGCFLFWRHDHRTKGTWGQILTYQAARGRNVIGLSFDDWDEIVRRMDFWWKRNRVRWAMFGATQRGISPERIVGHLNPKARPKPTPVPAGLVFTPPPVAVAPPPTVRVVPRSPLAGLTIAPGDAATVRSSAATGIFSGFRRGPGAAPVGSPFYRKPVKRAK